jgi:HK97 family phage prohead protease
MTTAAADIATAPAIERRSIGGEVRAEAPAEPAKPKRVTGYAAVFDSPSEDMGGFIETIKPGAFARTLKTADVRALISHQSYPVIGRTKAGTLRLSEDDRGLGFELDLPDTGAANDLHAAIERGDIDSMSFGFAVQRSEWDDSGPTPTRRLVEVELYEISFVAWPAYPATSIALRSLEDWRRDHPAPTPRRDATRARLDRITTSNHARTP